MYPDLRSRLRASLDPDPHVEPAPGDRLAAVLVPLVLGPEPSLVFTVRADHLPRHAGEVSFPGGMSEPHDTGLQATALREAQEEIGLDPASVAIIGALPAVHTFVSGILVVPFVGAVAEVPTLTVDIREIAGVFTVSLATLGSVERRIERARPDGSIWAGWTYDVDGGRIWGATGQMLHSLLLIAEGGPVSDSITPEDRELRALLGNAHTVAVVGLSSRPDRPSLEVARYLQEHGYTIIPVNPHEESVLGELAYPSLSAIPTDINVDVVDVFRRAEETPEVARDAVAIGAKVFWLQEGIVNDEAARIASQAGLDVIMGVCIKKVRQRLDGEDV